MRYHEHTISVKTSREYTKIAQLPAFFVNKLNWHNTKPPLAARFDLRLLGYGDMGESPFMALYSVDRLMAETRRLAVEFKKTTGQPLAVSGELANYDAIRLLNLQRPDPPLLGVDALGQGEWLGRRFQIKSRVLFDEGNNKPRVGQLNLEGLWDWVLLVLFDAEYQPVAIYSMDRPQLENLFNDTTKNKRGALTVARFRAIGQKVWQQNSPPQVSELGGTDV